VSPLHGDAVRVLSDWRPDDDGQDVLRHDFLAHLSAHEDGMWRECVPGHITASAALLDAAGERVLLILHPKIGRWVQLGGHCEHDDISLAGVALREAREESGIAHLRLLPGPVRVDRHDARCDGRSTVHLNVQYTAIAPPDARETVSAKARDLRWFGVDALPDLTDAAARDIVAMSRVVFARTYRSRASHSTMN
jgi:8-oxo-dGTP pyrophosphatase MutT (NUDIX family)